MVMMVMKSRVALCKLSKRQTSSAMRSRRLKTSRLAASSGIPFSMSTVAPGGGHNINNYKKLHLIFDNSNVII